MVLYNNAHEQFLVFGSVFVSLWGFLYLTWFVHFDVPSCWLFVFMWPFCLWCELFCFLAQDILERCYICSILDVISAITAGSFLWGIVFRGHNLSVRFARCPRVKLLLSFLIAHVNIFEKKRKTEFALTFWFFV